MLNAVAFKALLRGKSNEYREDSGKGLCVCLEGLLGGGWRDMYVQLRLGYTCRSLGIGVVFALGGVERLSKEVRTCEKVFAVGDFVVVLGVVVEWTNLYAFVTSKCGVALGVSVDDVEYFRVLHSC